VSLRIAFDLDGVLADMDGELARQAERLFGERVLRRPALESAGLPEAGGVPAGSDSKDPKPPDESPSNEPPRLKLQLTARRERRLWQHVQAIDGFWETLKEIEPGVVARLAALATDRRWEVIFVTKRPGSRGATAQVQTQRWLTSNGFALPSVFVVQGSRGRIAAALDLDLVVDDRMENCLDVVVDSKARGILVWREDESQLSAAIRRLGIGVVPSVAECLNILTEIDTATLDRPGMMERLKQVLRSSQCRSS
jgi:hypothetical protein